MQCNLMQCNALYIMQCICNVVQRNGMKFNVMQIQINVKDCHAKELSGM